MGFTLDSIITGKEKKPPIILFYAPQGVGKTTWASQAPKPIFIPCEDGIGELKYDRFSKPRTFEDVLSCITEVGSKQHDFKTLVIDTISAMEKIIHSDIRKLKGDNIFASFGKGHTLAESYFDNLTTYLTRLRDAKGMMIVLLAHCDIATFSPPGSDPYDTYTIRCHKKIQPKLYDWADIVLFGNYKDTVVTEDGEYGRKRSTAVGDETRAIYTRRRPAFLAKNRYELPFEMPLERQFDWKGFLKLIYRNLSDAVAPEEFGSNEFATVGPQQPTQEQEEEQANE
jgi:hypothetical protein